MLHRAYRRAHAAFPPVLVSAPKTESRGLFDGTEGTGLCGDGPTPYPVFEVAASPRSPIGYNGGRDSAVLTRVAASPRSPIGYNGGRDSAVLTRVAASPRSPIGYNRNERVPLRRHVAASPRSPIGYNAAIVGSSTYELRLPPDLPSATIEAASGQLGVRFGPASAGPRENDRKGLRTGRTAPGSCWPVDASVRRS